RARAVRSKMFSSFYPPLSADVCRRVVDKLSGLHDRPARRGRALAVCLTKASGFLMMMIRKVAPNAVLQFDNNLAVPSKAATARSRGEWHKRHTSIACAAG